MCLTPKRDDASGAAPSSQRGSEGSNTSEDRSNNSSSSAGRSSSSPTKGTSNAGGAPVLKLKGTFTTSIASKFGGTTPVFPKQAPANTQRRDSKDSIAPRRDSVGPRRDSVGPRRDSIGSVSLKKFENNSGSTGVEFTAIKLKKVSKVSSSSAQEEKPKASGIKTTTSNSEECKNEIKSEGVKTDSKDTKSANENGPKISAPPTASSKSSINDVAATSNDKSRGEGKSHDDVKEISVNSAGKTESRVRNIPVEREGDNGNATDIRKRDKSLDTKDSPDSTKSKLASMSSTSKVKVKKKIAESSDQVPCLKLSSKTTSAETVNGSVSSSLSVNTSSSSISKTITSDSPAYAISNSLCRSATIKSTEIPIIVSQADTIQNAKLSSIGKKTKKPSDGTVKKKKTKPKGEVIEIPIILESASEPNDAGENSVTAANKKNVADPVLDKTKLKDCTSSTSNDTSVSEAPRNKVAQNHQKSDDGAKLNNLADEKCSMIPSKGDQKSVSMTDKPSEPVVHTPPSRSSLESPPDVLKHSLPGEVAFSPTHAPPDICASNASTGHTEASADADISRSVQPSSPSTSISSFANISSSVCSVSTASSSPVCSLSAASSSSQSVCSLSNATDTLSTSISTSASDLSVSPPPTVTLPLASSMPAATDTSTSFSTASTSPSSAATTITSALPHTSTSTSSEPAIIIVRDMSSIAANINRTTIKAPASSTIGALFAEVGQKFGYEPDSFSLLLQSSAATDPLERLSPWFTLEEAGFQIDGVSRNSLLLMDLRNGQPKRTDASGASGRDDDLALGASASPSSCGGEDSGMYSSCSTATKEDSSSSYSARSKRLPVDSETTHEYTSYSSTSSLSSKHDTGYVGLVNQAMTCYLNSLLQTLFMTPEFRNALYRWEFKGSKEEATKSIPYQLQKLFLLLQTADRSAIETTSLTKSFGWDSSEAWQQHDIQELCRVMFEALEQSFANTDQANLIDTLYQGKMKDYVKCLVCGNENARMDSFLDIPLPIRPFGSSTAYQSLEEALRAFVAPELLSGNNQYQCSKCNAMCDAHKGLKFTKYPYLLTIHLKRFDFDYQTFHRIKLNDRVTFPNVLDLSEFLDDKDEKVAGTKVSSSSAKSDSAVSALDDSATDDSGSALDTEDSSVDFTPTQNCDDDEGIELSASDTEKSSLPEGVRSGSAKSALSKADVNGPKATGEQTRLDSASKSESSNNDVYTNYQLFSIMIHSGSASGGHYYAYIRDFLSGDWFCFNDQSVTRIGDEEIKRTYGGGGRSGSGYGASANAYMLMYRQCNEQRNVLPFAKDNFPSHIQKLCENLVVEEELEKEAREREKCTCVIKLFCQHPSALQLSDLKLRVHKDATLAEATKQAHELLDLHKSVPLERCRLVKYEEYHDSIESSFEDQDDKPMSEVLGGVKSSYKFDLLMEVREEHQQFESYQPGGVSFKVFIVNLAGQGEVDGPFITRGLLSMTVADLKKTIAASLNLNSETMRIASEGFYEEMKFLSDDAALLRSEGFYKSNKLFVEASGEESTNFYVGSQMASIIERYHNTITLYCTLPVVTPAILEELNIPPYVEDRPAPPLASSNAQAEEPRSECEGSSVDVVVNSSNATLPSPSPLSHDLVSTSVSDTSPPSIPLTSPSQNPSLPDLIPTNAPSLIQNSPALAEDPAESTKLSLAPMPLVTQDCSINSTTDNVLTPASSAIFTSSASTVCDSGKPPSDSSSVPVVPQDGVHVSASSAASVVLTAEPTSNLTQAVPDKELLIKSALPSCAEVSTPGATASANIAVVRPSQPALATTKADQVPSAAPPPPSGPSSKGSSPSSGASLNSTTQKPLGYATRIISPNAGCAAYGDAPSAPPAADICAAAAANLSDDDDVGDVSGGHYSALSSDQSTSEDSSLTSDSDRTLVGDPPDDDRLSEGGNSLDYHNVSSPEENNGAVKEAGACGWSASGGSCWSSEEASARGWWNEEDQPVRRYFKAQVMPEEGENRVLQIRVDKRMTVDQLKLELQPYVGVAVQHFKLYKKYIQEFECSRGGEQLNFGDSCKLVAKLDRALQVGEYSGKVYMLDLTNSEEPAKYLIDFVLRENDTVGQAKAAIVAEVEGRLGLGLRVEDVRLRRKSWKNPQSVYLDHQVFCERDISLHNNWELYLQERKGPEPKVCEDDLVLFVRRWRPSLYQLEPLEEIVLTVQTAEALREKLGNLSGVSAENIEFARGTGPFPHDVSVLDISSTLTWHSGQGPLDDSPYNVLYDGVLLYYRDKDEQLGVLTDSERSEVEAAENKRLNKDLPFTTTAAPSKPAREKGLKIYFNND